MQYSYDIATTLSETGTNIYQNGENPMFRIFCGDTLIDSYSEGASIIFSVNIIF